MYGKIKEYLQQELADIKKAGLYKSERVITSPQRAEIEVAGRPVLNFCANNYLGLSDNPRLIQAAKKAMDLRGFGMSSVRFICGCQDMHKELEQAISDYFGTEDTILYAACFDANGGVFEPLFTEQDAIISDALNHASIIDGVRLSKAVRYRYANADMEALEDCLKRAQAQRFRIICTDGVFSMDGNAAPLDEICRLARRYDALVMVDECHSAGVLGDTGHGITELYNLRGEVDILESPYFNAETQQAWQTLHLGESQEEDPKPTTNGINLSTISDWNIYWFEWSDDGKTLKCGINGETKLTYSADQSPVGWPYDDKAINPQGLYMLITLDAPNSWAGGAYEGWDSGFANISWEESKTNENTPRMEIDWIRFYISAGYNDPFKAQRYTDCLY